MSKRKSVPRGLLAPAILAASMAVALMIPASNPATAQTSAETRVLIERLNRLESDLVGLQRQVFQGQPPPVRGAGSVPTGVPAAPGDVWSRMDEFESSLRRLTGQLEEVDHRIAVLQQRLDKLVEDIDYRLTALERGQAPGQGGAVAPGQPPAPPAAQPPGPPQPQPQAAPPAGAPGPGVLGQLRVPPGQPIPGAEAPPPGAAAPQPQQAAAAPPAAARPATRLPEGSPQDRYNFAIGLLRQGDYAEAEAAFAEFLGAHANDPLAGNAQYWLGETYYVRRDYERSAAAFLQAYQKYPKGNKAPDSLVKLGMSLMHLNQKQEACAVFNQFSREHPQAPAPLKQLAATERTRAGCR